MNGLPPPPPPTGDGVDVFDVLGGISDVAIVILTVLAIAAAVWIGLRQIKAGLPNAVLTYQYHVEANSKHKDRSDGYMTSPLSDARTARERAAQVYPDLDYVRWNRLRVTVTNKGGAPISVEAIGWETTTRGLGAASGSAGTPTYPHLLEPHHYTPADRIYGDVVNQAAGGWVRGYAILSNGETAYGEWVLLDAALA
ncbi:hypothetical protein J7E29_16575 [Streptomyces sp. ISL-90]|nr:hypothetical protein [Streptomyces sp. ISL-90]